MAKKAKKLKPSANHGCPCPKCGSRSRILRTSIGDRVKTSARNYVVRERVCFGSAHHRFVTEERPRRG